MFTSRSLHHIADIRPTPPTCSPSPPHPPSPPLLKPWDSLSLQWQPVGLLRFLKIIKSVNCLFVVPFLEVVACYPSVLSSKWTPPPDYIYYTIKIMRNSARDFERLHIRDMKGTYSFKAALFLLFLPLVFFFLCLTIFFKLPPNCLIV